jgi:putative ubiquitin-RnfH superfamily antitoxin RatB of RatAB toxin-antitoxin module
MEKNNVALASLASLARWVLLVCGASLLVNAFVSRLGILQVAGISAVGFFAAMALATITATIDARINSERKKRTDDLEKKADARSAWDLARFKLEEYFDRNLQQVKMIFYVAIGVMTSGFIFIIWGLREAVTGTRDIHVAEIASAAGVITQFIGLTFMAIYRSTMLQATQYVSVLENINTVGMAVGILEAMKEDNGDLKDVTRVEIVRMLLAPPSTRITFPPRSSRRTAKSAQTESKEASAPGA